MKRIISVFLLLAIMLSFAACGKKAEPAPAQPTPAQSQTGITKLDEEINESIQQAVQAELQPCEPVSPEDLKYEENETGITITEYNGSAEFIALPDTIDGKAVTKIGYCAFRQSEVKSVEIPDSVELIDAGGFYCCSELLSVKCGSGLKTIGESAFQLCTALREIAICDGLETIGYMAFSSTTSLSTINLPASLQFIDAGAFVFSGLTEVSLPGSIQRVTNECFANCASLTKVTIGEGITFLEEGAFRECDLLKEVYLPTSLAECELNVFHGYQKATVICASGSFAESYAKEHDMKVKYA